jgi:hypothetical protein
MRFWVEFDWPPKADAPPGTLVGVGVTAIDRDDALRLVAHRVFGDASIPPVKEIRDDVDIATPDEGHVLPNMGPPHVRGIWFPLGY